MSVPRFLPWWLGGEADRVDGGVSLPRPDALPERPEPVDDPLPEELERLLRDPEIAVPGDEAVHALIAAHLRRDPEATVRREAYLNLWALYERMRASGWEASSG